MKKLKLSIVALLFSCSFLAFSPVYAGDGNNGNGNGNANGNDKNGKDGTSMPINNGVWFLLLAGAAVGTTVILRKNKLAVTKRSNVE